MEKEVAVYLPLDSYGLEQYTAGEYLHHIGRFLMVMVLAMVLFLIGQVPLRPEYVFAGILASVLAAGSRFDGWKIRQEKKLLEELSDYVDDLRHAFYRDGDVEDAIYEAWNMAGEEWKLHLLIMEDSLFSEELPQVYESCRPPDYVVHFLAICQCALRYGSEGEGQEGSFLHNLEDLQHSIQLGTLRMERERELFSMAEPGLILPLLCLPLMERWSVTQISELNLFYGNSWGGLIRLILCLILWLAMRMLRFLRIGFHEKGVIGKKTIETDLDGQKTEWGRYQQEDTFHRIFLVWNRMEGRLGQWTGNFLERLEPGKSIIHFYSRRMELILGTFLIGMGWYIMYKGSPARLLILPLAVLLASFVPYLELLLAGEFYMDARRKEVSQFHSVLYLLSSVPQMTVEVILTWLERFGCYYRESITRCLDWYECREEWLAECKQEEEETGFRHIMEDVVAADKVGIREAFRDMVSKREFWHDRARQQNEMAMRKKEIYVQLLVLLPFVAAVITYLILPFLYEGMKNLLSFVESGTR